MASWSADVCEPSDTKRMHLEQMRAAQFKQSTNFFNRPRMLQFTFAYDEIKFLVQIWNKIHKLDLISN